VEAARTALRAADAGLTAAKAEAEAAEAQLGEVGAAIDAAEAALKGGAAVSPSAVSLNQLGISKSGRLKASGSGATDLRGVPPRSPSQV